jgi:hypothetical protein
MSLLEVKVVSSSTCIVRSNGSNSYLRTIRPFPVPSQAAMQPPLTKHGSTTIPQQPLLIRNIAPPIPARRLAPPCAYTPSLARLFSPSGTTRPRSLCCPSPSEQERLRDVNRTLHTPNSLDWRQKDPARFVNFVNNVAIHNLAVYESITPVNRTRCITIRRAGSCSRRPQRRI